VWYSFGFTLLCIILENHNLFHHWIFSVKPSIAMPLLKLPNELLLMIASYIIDDYDYDGDESRFAHLNSFHQVNSRLYLCLNTILWQKAVDAGYGFEERVLAHSINTNNLERLKFFLSLGADVETRLRTFEVTEGECLNRSCEPTPLIAAAYLDNVTMARLFLEKGAKVQYSLDDKYDEPCYHAMHAARSAEMVQLLLDHGADPELADSHGDRPLHWYVRRSNIAAMRTILQRGANVDSASEGSASGRTLGPERTPLYEAVRVKRSMDAVNILLEFGADVKKGDLMLNYNTPLHAAVMSGDMESVRLLLERWPEGVRAQNSAWYTPLHVAAEQGKTDMVRLFLEHWPEGLKVENWYGNTPLHAAAVAKVQKGMLDVFKLLVDSWPEGRVAVNGDEQTPLQAFQMNAPYRKSSRRERRAIIALLSGVC
jgi:ankyrin repeat protein